MGALELAFETKPLREICESQEKAKQQLGARIAAVLKDRLADLRAAATVADLPLGEPHKVSGGYVLELSDEFRLIVSPNHKSNPVLSSGAIDWAKVSRIKIIDLEMVK
jgi:hypothetical protein